MSKLQEEDLLLQVVENHMEVADDLIYEYHKAEDTDNPKSIDTLKQAEDYLLEAAAILKSMRILTDTIIGYKEN